MKKRIFIPVLLLLCMIAALAGPAAAAALEVPAGAVRSGRSVPSGITVTIDGVPRDFRRPVILTDGTTYVSLREFSVYLGAKGVYWRGGKASIVADGLDIEAVPGRSYIVANGRYLFVPSGVLLVEDTVLVPIRVLARAFGCAVEWRGEASAIEVTSGTGPIAPGGEFYAEEDVLWLSRIIKAEAGNQPFFGKIAVGNVVMNRVTSPYHPDTVRGVIFDGVQFTPAMTGAVYNTPDEECVIAAKVALDGGNVAGDSLYFATSANCWAGRNRPFVMTLGGHSFWA